MKIKYLALLLLILLTTCNGTEGGSTNGESIPGNEGEPWNGDWYAVRDNLTTQQLILEMGLGINLGNTLESTGDWINSSKISNYETAWGSPIITKAMIKGYADAGFSSLRIPVTWSNMMQLNYVIHPDLLNRVEEIVKWTIDSGMVVMINTHHDSG